MGVGESEYGGVGETGAAWRAAGLAIREELARGGMGIVYRAEQEEPRRDVAVKVLKPEWAGNEAVRERFRHEAQAMATLDHPAILPVFEVGEADGLPWFSMKLATGGSLAGRLGSYGGDWRRIAELVAGLADALAFAHGHGLLHRDIKPANVLFDADGRAYLADFGVAKQLAESDSLRLAETRPDALLGTPAYLPPEALEGRGGRATTAGDVYGLGVLLYELLAGSPPFRAETLPVLFRRIAEDPVPPVAREGERVPPRDLESIARRALEKRPGGRYASAAEMASDLRCFLRGEPTLARPVTEFGRFYRWCRRRPALAGAGLLTVTLLVVVAAGSTLAAWRIRIAERQSREARIESERHLQQSRLAEAAAVREGRRLRFRARALELVASATGPLETDEVRSQRRAEAAAALAFPEVARVLIPASPGSNWVTCATSEGLQYVAWKERDTKRWRVIDTWREGLHAEGEADGAPQLLSADGLWMAVVNPGEAWELWDLRSAPPRLLRRYAGVPEDIASDGRRVAWCEARGAEGRDACVAEAESGRELFRVRHPVVNAKIRFSPDGEHCVMAPSSYLNRTNFPYAVRIHRAEDGVVERELSSGLANCIWCLAWGGSGRDIVAGERGGATYVWDARTGRQRHVFRGEGSDLWMAAISPDGHRLATLSEDRLFQVRDLATGQLLGRSRAWLAHRLQWMSWSARFPGLVGPVSLDEEDVWIRVIPGAYRAVRAADSHGSALGLAVSPDGETVVVGDSRHARWWREAGQTEGGVLAPGLWSVFAFSGDGRWLFGAGEGGVGRWPVLDGRPDAARYLSMAAGDVHSALGVESGARRLAVNSEIGGQVLVFDDPGAESPRGARQLTSTWVSSLGMDGDGRRVAMAGPEGLRVQDAATGALLFSRTNDAWCVAMSPDGGRLVIGGPHYEVWDARAWRRVRELSGQAVNQGTSRAVFSADGEWVATAHASGRIALWHPDEGWPLMVLESPARQLCRAFCFTRDRARLLVATGDGVVETWDLRFLEKELRQRGLGW